jgi:hypothetical protein
MAILIEAPETLRLLLQRHFAIRPGQSAFVVAAASLGLPLSPPSRPVEAKGLLGAVAQPYGKQAPHLRDRHRDQVGGAPPFSPPAAARVTSRNA